MKSTAVAAAPNSAVAVAGATGDDRDRVTGLAENGASSFSSQSTAGQQSASANATTSERGGAKSTSFAA